MVFILNGHFLTFVKCGFPLAAILSCSLTPRSYFSGRSTLWSRKRTCSPLGSTSWFFEPRESSRPSSSTKYETTIFWSRARPLSNPACCPISTPRPINLSAPCLLTVICSLPQGKTTSHSNPDPCLHCPLGEPYASTFLFLSSWPMSAFWNPWISRITSLLKLFHHGPKSPLERFPILYITLNVYGSVPHIRGFSNTKPPNLMRRVALGHL